MPKQRKRGGYPNTVEVTSIGVRYSRKFNLGDYNSIDLELSIWASVSPEADVAEVIPDLQNVARNNVMIEANRVIPKLKVEGLARGLKAHEVQEAIDGAGSNDADTTIVVVKDGETVAIHGKKLTPEEEAQMIAQGKIVNPIPAHERSGNQ